MVSSLQRLLSVLLFLCVLGGVLGVVLGLVGVERSFFSMGVEVGGAEGWWWWG